jgi:hypothetical protein
MFSHIIFTRTPLISSSDDEIPYKDPLSTRRHDNDAYMYYSYHAYDYVKC